MSDEKAAQEHPIIAFRVPLDLQHWCDQQAAREGISRADYARRELLLARQRQQSKEGAAA
jgi:hypothetical protein